MSQYSEKRSAPHPVFYARQHYERVRQDRRDAKVRLIVSIHPSIGHQLLGHHHPNQYTRRRLIQHFGLHDLDGILDGIDRAAWLHGRICIPHPACPEAFELCRWISYHDAVAITGRSSHTFARWRWDANTYPDESVWRLLEWTVHSCCAWPQRAPRQHYDAPANEPPERSPYPAMIGGQFRV